MNRTEASNLLRSLDIRPKSKLGQTFLVDENILQKQINSANLGKLDIVLEIGPGLGGLTKKIATLAKKVIAIEYDKKLCSYLESELPDNVELICGDALDIDFPNFNKIVSNLPYQISSPVIFKLINYQFDLGILMFQAEFGKRLVAEQNTKSYSRLTVMSSYYFDINLLHQVSKTSFLPIPKVDSVLIKIEPKQERMTAIDERLFINFIKVIFTERRKMIKNSLLNQFLKLNPLKSKLNTKSDLKNMIAQLPNVTCRPEQLSLEQLIQMSNELHLILSKSFISNNPKK